MAQSPKWNMNDNIYVLNREYRKVIPSTKGVDPMIVEYCKNHSLSECYRLNNRFYSMYIRPSDEVKKQYNINRDYITNMFNK